MVVQLWGWRGMGLRRRWGVGVDEGGGGRKWVWNGGSGTRWGIVAVSQ